MAEGQERQGPLLLLDGMSLAFRAYYALPDTLATKSGVVTNAAHGFTSMLQYLIREQKPSAVAVAFDAPGDTFRDEMLEDYKAGRAATPWLLPAQFDIIREIMDALAIPVIEAPGFEADDVIATLATQAAERGCEVVIVTGDRDSYQLVQDPYIRVLYNKRGVSDYALYDEAGIQERTGVTPDKYVLLAALRGDPSDNLPGIPGVGEKTAAKLINKYGDLDGVFSHVAEQTPKLRQNLEENEHLARSNARLIPLVRDVPLDVDVGQLELGGWDPARAEATFEEYEMKTVWQRLVELLDAGALGEPLAGTVPRSRVEAATAGDEEPAPAPLEVRDVALPTTAAEAAKQLGELGQGQLAVAGRWNGMPGRSDLVALLLLATEGEEAGLGVLVTAEQLATASVAKKLTTLLAQPVLGHNVKELMRSLLPFGIDITGLEMDTGVAAYLLDASTGEYQLQQLREQTGQLSLEIVDAGETAADLAKDAAGEAADVFAMAHSFRTRLTADDMVRLHDDIERPLVRVLAKMEVAGIAVDRSELQSIADELKESAATLQDEVQKIAGHEFNVNSTPQLRTVLFDELGLTPGKKTKTGYSTDAQTLEKMRDDHPIIETLLNYREVEKLRSTYGESLLAEVQDDGRIHASFGQTVARTGRISSDRPNLHNIPVRSDLGKQFRKAFVPGEGSTFLVADYDQVELRCIAHLSQDPGLIDAMTSGADVHRTVAAAVYGIPVEEVTHTQREFCKMVSYGLAYGMEAYGLSQRLGVAVEEAAAIMESYFGAFPLVKQYMDDTVAEAKIRGYTRTMFGRMRPLPDLHAANYRVRQAAERQAMNAGIQGLAADIFKLALVRLDRDIEEAKLES
ncbi:MAG TPA: DNA polymerase I, partial [Acidimicrobiales bacterium]|nr:DNA polymerase I [Acidimicrobiales bacterium]